MGLGLLRSTKSGISKAALILMAMSNLQSEIGAFRRETLIAIDAVERGLAIAASAVPTLGVESKGERDLVTAADIAVEDSIREYLAKLDFPVIGEERGGQAPADGSPYWLVDPICGTRNFASGMTLYCVNLALVENGRVTVAVVGDASRNEIVVGERGQGAWANSARRRLITSDEGRTIVIEEVKSQDPRRERVASSVAAAIRADRWDFRSLGSSVGLPYVAAGRISAYISFRVSHPLHAAAGALLAAEAGCSVSDINGEPWTLDSDSIAASANVELHRELLEIVRLGG